MNKHRIGSTSTCMTHVAAVKIRRAASLLGTMALAGCVMIGNTDSALADKASEAENCQKQFDLILGSSTILFDSAASTIRKESKTLLDVLASTAKSCPSAKIEIGGHTDASGNDDSNQKLSENRASSVKSYLVKAGVSAGNLSAAGYGEAKPIASNDTDKGKAENRRIEFNVVTKMAAVKVATTAAKIDAGAIMRHHKLMPLGPVPIPADNKQSADKIKLGKMLFFDPRVGGDASTGCVTCHEPDQGMAFSDAFSRGYPGTVHWRNSQTVVNTGYLGKVFWVGASPSLEHQARSAARGGVAGNGEGDMMEVRMAFIPEYAKLFKSVFGDERPKVRNIWRAIASYERTLNQVNPPIDKFLKGDKSAISAEAQKGFDLFNGKAGCVRCHNGQMATDEKYYNLGVPAPERWNEDGLAQITFRFEQYAKGNTEKMYRSIKDDAGLYYRTKEKRDKGKFRTAPLRYINYTAPYMHNGAFWTLEEVVDFYNEGGGENEFAKNKTKLLKPLGLSDEEKENLVAFLQALSGPELKIDQPELPNYAPLPAPAN